MSVRDRRAVVGGAFLTERSAADAMQIPETFDDELRLMGNTAARFLEREILPVLDRLEALDYALSREVMAKAGSVGLLALDVPEEDGGLGGSKTASALVSEVLAGSGSFNVTFSAHTGIGTLPLVYFGNVEQRAAYLPKLMSGAWIAAYGLTEPGSGSDALAATTKAVLDGDDYVLNGTKMWISNAGFADLFTVFAQVDGTAFSAFLVEATTPGLSLGAEERKMGIKGSSTRQVILENARVPRANLLGEVGKGHHIALGILNIGRFKLAAGAVGGAKAMVGYAARYAKERRQFGVPIASFGLIQEKIGRMAAATFALESAVYRLAAAMDDVLVGVPRGVAQSRALNEYVVEYSLIKVFGSEILDDVIDDALQTYGGYGFSADYPIELAYRNSRINRIFEGTNEINRELAVDQLLRKALRGDLDLLGPAQQAMKGAPLQTLQPSPADTADALLAVENLKRATLLVAGLGATHYGQALEGEQELVARVADALGLIYLAESALLRAERLHGTPKGPVATDLARSYAFFAVDRGRESLSEALRRVEGGPAAMPRLAAYLPEHGVDLIGLRRAVAKTSFDADGYPL